MKTRAAAVIVAGPLLALLSIVTSAQAPGQSPYPVTVGQAFKFEKVAEGVYYATSTGAMVTGSNIPVIVNTRDVMIVDTGTTPAAARALEEDLKKVTDKPVRYVVNTHFHYDHTDGNSVFAGRADIIAHDYVRHAILDLNVLEREPFKTSQLTNVPNRIESLTRQLASEKDAGRRTPLGRQLAAAQAGWEQLKEIKPTAPNVTYSSKMVLHDGQREIRLLFLGRGHTQGDTFVFLPKERIVCTGDMMESTLAYMGDAMFDEWITSLDALKQLDFDLVLPGHGIPFTGKSKITAFQSYLGDLMSQVADLRKQGVSADEAARRVDLTSHRADFPETQHVGADLRGVRRLYEWMDESTAPLFTQQATNVFRRFAVDLAKMKDFYGDVLGLKPLPTLNMPGGGQMTRFHVGASEIKLQPAASESQVASGGVGEVIGLRVLTFFFPDGRELAARFKEHGYPAPEFHQTPAGVTARSVAMVRDPSGQWVELVVAPGAPAETFDRLEIGLTVSDIETSRAFYRGFVGLEELKPVVDESLGTTKYPFRLGTTTINVWAFGKGLPVNKSSAGIQYVVGNVDAIDARAKAKGVKIDRPLSDFTATLRTVWLGDPDGITNYFAQVARRTPAADPSSR